jgi:hypothetical protein
MKKLPTFEEFINEAATTSWSKMMKGVKTGDTGPWSIIAIDNKKVIDQHINIKIMDSIPAHFEEMRRQHPKASIHIEDNGGKVVWTDKK